MTEQSSTRTTAGFTLFELLIVIVIASILALIAAPSWIGFTNNRRTEAARDQVFQILRQAQTQAQASRRPKVVNFITSPSALPSVSVDGVAQPIDAQTGNQSNPRFIGLSVTNGNTNGCGTGATSCIIFDDRGNIRRDDNQLGEEGIKVVLTSPADNRGSRKCVVVATLLGAMQNRSGADCD